MKSTQEILDLEKTLLKLENLHASFDYLRISIASPKRIKSWAERTLPNGEIIGEVLRPETINFRTHQPELYGLFCEKIFGPIKNWKCRCGKYNGFALDKICEDCNVEVIEARVRRYRMGYIELTCPVTHIWYLKGVPNYLSILLRCFDEGCTGNKIEQVVYFKEGARIISEKSPLYRFFVKDGTNNKLKKFFQNSSTNYYDSNSNKSAQKRKGAEIVKAALENINISNEIKKARSLVNSNSLTNLKGIQTPDKATIRRIRILESF
jgi:DNA-directed RNA polymerase subunit beta'